jgi:hypothetical protein
LLTRWDGWNKRTVTRGVLALALILLLALGLYAFWIEPSGLRTNPYDIALSGDQTLPLRPLRIAVLADIHLGAPYIDDAKLARIVALTQDAKPDLILLAGDYIAYRYPFRDPPSLADLSAGLRGLSAPLGVYAVLGNHDNARSTPGVRHALEAAGITVLDDASTILTRGGARLYLVGFKDAYWSHPDVARALAGVPADAHALCLTHSPDLFPLLPKTCVLTIAGHTHGGQVRLPFVGSPIVPSRFGQRYAAGEIHEDGKTLFVSTGIGTSMIPVRFGVPPEVSLLTVN